MRADDGSRTREPPGWRPGALAKLSYICELSPGIEPGPRSYQERALPLCYESGWMLGQVHPNLDAVSQVRPPDLEVPELCSGLEPDPRRYDGRALPDKLTEQRRGLGLTGDRYPTPAQSFLSDSNRLPPIYKIGVLPGELRKREDDGIRTRCAEASAWKADKHPIAYHPRVDKSTKRFTEVSLQPQLLYLRVASCRTALSE